MKTKYLKLVKLISLFFFSSVITGIGMIPPSPVTPSNTQPSQSAGTTYYIRPDGGSVAQCTGRVNASYPGSGTNQPCAWDHPFRALKPPHLSTRLHGGDTLIIADGSYPMGFGAPGAGKCDYEGSYECHMPPIPSGPDAAHPTRILGAGWDSGCANPPELWGKGRPWFILNMTDSSNVEVACLEITDHSSCIEDHMFPIGGSKYTCQRDTPPYGNWAATGLYAEDSTNVSLKDLNIHGLANTGVQAGRLRDWTVDDVRIAGNGLSGWNGDLVGDGTNSANHGTLTFRHWVVEWNGCGETYPDERHVGCWGQEAGGYGDGVGTGTTAGHWIIEDSAFLHNTSDGLDLLYARLSGAVIDIRRTIAKGNDGNQIKTSGTVTIENSIVVSNCGFFEEKRYPYWNSDDTCRAGGDALSFDMNPGGHAAVINSTITGEGGCLAIAVCALDKTCDGTEEVLMRNVIFQGQKEFFYPDEDTCFAWYDDESDLPLPADPFIVDYSLITGVQFGNVTPCPGSNNLCNVPSGLVNTAIDNFSAHLKPDSPAIDAGTMTSCPSVDKRGLSRPRDGDKDGTADCDIGAYEFNPTYLMNYLSQATNDGWVLETSETSNIGGILDASTATFYLGDDQADKQYRSILSFNTASLPDTAVITSVKIKIKKQGLVGTNPFTTHQGLLVDIRKPYFGTALGLVASDFQATASKGSVGTFGTTPSAGWYSVTLSSTARPYINKTGATQFRLRFLLDDNDDMGDDYMMFYSGDRSTEADRPVLVVQYYVP